jgi:hypothetical protein
MSPTTHAFSCNLDRIATLSAYIQYTDSKADELTCKGTAELGGDGNGVDAPGGKDQGSERGGGGGKMNILNENPAFSAFNKF